MLTNTSENYEERVHASAPPPFWMRLDNAAKIYPAVQNEELTAVFRLSCILKQRVKIRPLLDAIRRIENRFPYYKAKPKKGFFWYYLEFQDEPIPLMPDLAVPCRAFGKDDLIFRILVKDNRLSVEFSHILTDGGGGFEFLKTLLLTYFEACCISFKEEISFMKPEDVPEEEEFEDSFSRCFRGNIPSPPKKPKSFHLPFSLNKRPRFNVLVASIPLNEITAKSKSYQVTITEYLVGVYLHALQFIYKRLSDFRKRRRSIFRILNLSLQMR